MKNKKNHVDMADVCELAHKLAEDECAEKGIVLDCNGKKRSKNYCGDDDNDHEDTEMTHYSKKGQEIFDYYYDNITNILNV